MPTREELGNALLDCLRDVSALLDHAHAVAVEEREALVRNDAEAIASSCVAQEEVMRRIAEADQRAAAVAERLAEDAGLDPDTADHDAIADAAGPTLASRIRQELFGISLAAEEISRVNEANSRLLSNGLEIIATCLRTVAPDESPVVYANDAQLQQRGGTTLGLDMAA